MVNKAESFDASVLTDRELASLKNLAEVERKTIVIGDGIFNLLLSKVEAEINKRDKTKLFT